MRLTRRFCPTTAPPQATITAVLGQGLLIGRRDSSDPTRSQQHQLPFGCSPQDAWTVLGAPEGRADANDAMLIHAAAGRGGEQSRCAGDYFLNYFSLGLDILFCAEARLRRHKAFIVPL